MSYDIYLLEPVSKERVIFPEKHHMSGGTYAIGGTNEAWLNITYNYSSHYVKHIDEELGIRWLYGKTAADTIERLQAAADAMGDDVDGDYWEPTEGNAKRPLLQLVAMAKMRPDAIWDGD